MILFPTPDPEPVVIVRPPTPVPDKSLPVHQRIRAVVAHWRQVRQQPTLEQQPMRGHEAYNAMTFLIPKPSKPAAAAVVPAGEPDPLPTLEAPHEAR